MQYWYIKYYNFSKVDQRLYKYLPCLFILIYVNVKQYVWWFISYTLPGFTNYIWKFVALKYSFSHFSGVDTIGPNTIGPNTFGPRYIWPKYIWPKIHLAQDTFGPRIHLAQITFGPRYIWPKDTFTLKFGPKQKIALML